MSIKSKFEVLLDLFARPSDLAGDPDHKVGESGDFNDLLTKPSKISEYTNDGAGDASGPFIDSTGKANPVEIHESGFAPGPEADESFTVDGAKSSSGELLISTSATPKSFIVPYFTVDEKGRVTGYSNKTITLNIDITNNYSNYYNYSNYQNYSNYYSYSNYRNYNNYANYGAYASYGAYGNYYATYYYGGYH